MNVEQQHKWLQKYEALTWGLAFLKMLARHMGGFKSEMWVDGKLCFARGGIEDRADPFHIKNLGKRVGESENATIGGDGPTLSE